MKTVWRVALDTDYPAIVACHQQLEQKLGTELDLPRFDAPSILAWMVAVRDEQIVQFYFIERCVELRMGGMDHEALQALIQDAPAILGATRDAGIRFMHCCVPPDVEENIGRHLGRAGLYRSPNILFAADLR